MDIGLRFEGGKEPDIVKRIDNRAYVKCKDGSEFEADILLYALGRTANVENLDIENAGIKLNERGYIPVNVLFQTVVPHIYAVGDVIGGDFGVYEYGAGEACGAQRIWIGLASISVAISVWYLHDPRNFFYRLYRRPAEGAWISLRGRSRLLLRDCPKSHCWQQDWNVQNIISRRDARNFGSACDRS